jgi:hypothetical protein
VQRRPNLSAGTRVELIASQRWEFSSILPV